MGFSPGKVDGHVGNKTVAAVNAFLEAFKVANRARWNDARKVIAAKQLICQKHSIEVGGIDGLVGPQTRFAFDSFAHLKLHGVLPKPWRDTDTTPPLIVPKKTVWPKQSGVSKFFGAVGQNQTSLVLPFPMKIAWNPAQSVKQFSIHEKVHDSAKRVFTRVLDHYGPEQIATLKIDLFGGCLNVRKMRGGSAWSMHAWGIAIDFDPERNQLKWGRDRASLAKPQYERFWQLWEEEGWLSLGRARNYDWMHVQAARV